MASSAGPGEGRMGDPGAALRLLGSQLPRDSPRELLAPGSFLLSPPPLS